MTLTATPAALRAVESTADGEPSRVWLDVTLDREATEAATDKREVVGLFAPYGVEIERADWRTGTTRFRIDADALATRDDAKVFYGHDWQDGGMPIGRITSTTSSAEGLRGVATLAKTAKADEVHALVLDGTLDRFSVGFYINAYTVENADTANPVLVVTAGDVFEVSIVPYPAYADAAIESVNSERNPMTTPTPTAEKNAAPASGPTADDYAALSEAVDTLTRQFATLGDQFTGSTAAEVPFSSYGHFVKAMLNRDHERHAEAEKFAVRLAYGDNDGEGVADDTTYRDTWVGDVIRLIDRPRKVYNLFESAPLPAEGMGVEYGVLEENDIDVAEQLAEGEPLVMGKIKVGTDTADVITFGGAAKQSFQQAQRSNVNVLDLTWRALAIAYAKTTEQYVRTLLADPAAVDPHEIGTLAGLTDADAWVDWLVDVALYFDDKGLDGEYLRVTPDIYKDLAKLRLGSDGPYVLDRSSGSVNLTELTGNVSGLRVTLVPGTGLVEVGHSSALRTFQSSGAPARLGPEQDILTLTQAVGVYGFNAVAVQDQKAIVRAATA